MNLESPDRSIAAAKSRATTAFAQALAMWIGEQPFCLKRFAAINEEFAKALLGIERAAIRVAEETIARKEHQ